MEKKIGFDWDIPQIEATKTCWCMQCKKKQVMSVRRIWRREIKPQSFRYFVTGICKNCKRTIQHIVKKEKALYLHYYLKNEVEKAEKLVKSPLKETQTQQNSLIVAPKEAISP